MNQPIPLAALVLVVVSVHAPSQCPFDWTPGFGQRGIPGSVYALRFVDLGTGPRLYAGGSFGFGTTAQINNAAMWDGAQWVPLGLGTSSTVTDLAGVDFGSGPLLYASGSFTMAGGAPAGWLATWDGSNWAPTTINTVSSGFISKLLVSPGPPTALYALSTNRVHVTTGGAWSTLGVGPFGGLFNAQVLSIAIFDDGSGPTIFAGGLFTEVDGAFAHRIAKWNGSAFVEVGGGIPDGAVEALAVHDDGTGPALYVGGSFTSAGSLAVSGLARWSGQTWSAVGGSFGANVNIVELSTHDVGNGPELFAGGFFATAPGGVAASNVAKWDGMAWAPFGTGTGPPNPSVETLASLAGSTALYAGGNFVVAGGQAVNHVASWDGSGWHPMPGGDGFGGGVVGASVVHDDGSGPALYLGGSFNSAGPVATRSVIRFDGTHWTALGPGLPGDVSVLAFFDDGGGPKLYAGGAFNPLFGPPFYIAVWDGMTWSQVGTGGPTGRVNALEPIENGPFPPLLAVGGEFTNLGGTIPSGRVAFWNGATWSPSPAPVGLTSTNALAYLDDGSGPALYAAGSPSGPPGSCWKFTGTTWMAVPGVKPAIARDFQMFDDGTGPALYVSGSQSLAVPGATVCKLVAGSFAQLGGVAGPAGAGAMTVFDDGSGSALHVAGGIGMPPSDIARWTGSGWVGLGGGAAGPLNNPYPGTPLVFTLIAFDDGDGPALYVGGQLSLAGAVPSSSLARWAPRRPRISFSQPGPGAPVTITCSRLVPGVRYHNLFSLEPCGVVGTGPYAGLCATDPEMLAFQFMLPLGALPFHFAPGSDTVTFGPYPAPSGVTFDAVSLDCASYDAGCTSVVRRYTTQ